MPKAECGRPNAEGRMPKGRMPKGRICVATWHSAFGIRHSAFGIRHSAFGIRHSALFSALVFHQRDQHPSLLVLRRDPIGRVEVGIPQRTLQLVALGDA
jgi:hypothetical protein